jgi:hypothetical protein
MVHTMGGRRISCAALALGAWLLVGCGDDGDDKTGKANAKAGKSAPGQLERPVHARCGTEGFARPKVAQVPSDGVGGPVWSLQYVRRGTAGQPPVEGQTTLVLVVESSPAIKLPKPTAVLKEQVIGGRRIYFAPPAGKVTVFTAQWKTTRAVYSLVANGKQTTTVKRFIACMP